MKKTINFYPRRIGDQILWLTNWSDKIVLYQLILGYTAAKIAATVADAQRVLYLLKTVQSEAQIFAHTMTSHIDLMQNGSGSALMPLPVFALPTTPPPPDNVLPGALKRIMALIANLKTRPGYTTDIGTNLQIISTTVPVDPGAIPDPDAVAEAGQVVLSFIKAGHERHAHPKPGRCQHRLERPRHLHHQPLSRRPPARGAGRAGKTPLPFLFLGRHALERLDLRL